MKSNQAGLEAAQTAANSAFDRHVVRYHKDHAHITCPVKHDIEAYRPVVKYDEKTGNYYVEVRVQSRRPDKVRKKGLSLTCKIDLDDWKLLIVGYNVVHPLRWQCGAICSSPAGGKGASERIAKLIVSQKPNETLVYLNGDKADLRRNNLAKRTINPTAKFTATKI